MKVGIRVGVLAILALTACSEPAADKDAAAATAAGSSATPVSLPDAPAAGGEAACAPVRLDVSPAKFTTGAANFAEGTPGRTRLAGNFDRALAEACAAGWLARQPLVDPRSTHKDTLFIANAPESNQATIYFDGTDTVIEGPFVDSVGHVQFPGSDAIKEAIYCHVVGATEAEQEQEGRCLPD